MGRDTKEPPNSTYIGGRLVRREIWKEKDMEFYSVLTYITPAHPSFSHKSMRLASPRQLNGPQKKPNQAHICDGNK